VNHIFAACAYSRLVRPRVIYFALCAQFGYPRPAQGLPARATLTATLASRVGSLPRGCKAVPGSGWVYPTAEIRREPLIPGGRCLRRKGASALDRRSIQDHPVALLAARGVRDVPPGRAHLRTGGRP
jgi:hypothetical protein